MFGIEESEAQNVFADMIKANIESESKEETFQFIHPKIVDSSLVASRALADPKILENQILEEMKYKAQVEIAPGKEVSGQLIFDRLEDDYFQLVFGFGLGTVSNEVRWEFTADDDEILCPEVCAHGKRNHLLT